MSTQTTIHMATVDTAEKVAAPVLPADNRAGDGYDWMDTLEGTPWSVLPNWASEGWDAGSWPYIIFAVARSRDVSGELFGYGTYVEGDTSTHWFRSQNACFEAITAEVFFHWAVRRPGQPPRHSRGTAGPGSETLPRLDHLKTPEVSRPPLAGTQERHTETR